MFLSNFATFFEQNLSRPSSSSGVIIIIIIIIIIMIMI